MKYNIPVFLLLISINIYAQQVGTWKNYSNMSDVNDAVVTSEGIWAVTTGGAFYYDFDGNTYLELNKAKGLSSNNLTAVTVDKYGNIWFGSSSGTIDIYNPESGLVIKHIMDIYNSDKTKKQVNELRAEGDTIYAALDFGLSLINANSYSFYDTYLKLGSFSTDTKVISSFKDDVLFVATENGIAKQKKGQNNLSFPDSWENFTTTSGLLSESVGKFVLYKNSIIVSSAKGLAAYNSSGVWTNFIPSLNNASIVDLISRNDSLFILTSSEFFVYANDLLSSPYVTTPYSQNGLSAKPGRMLLLTDNGIVEPKVSGSYNYIAPLGPSSNVFMGMAVDEDGNLWAGSGNSPGTGFYKFDGSTWTNYYTSAIPKANFPSFIKVFVAPDNTKYFMNWGDGFTRLKDNKFQIFNTYNTDLVGISKDVNYLVVQGLATDSKGNLWILTYDSANKIPLAVLKTDSTWAFYNDVLSDKILQGYDLVVDEYYTKWMLVSDEGSSTGNRLYYFNESKSVTSSDKNGWGSVTESNGLSSSTVNTMVLDRRGEIWVGTSAGLNSIVNTKSPRSVTTIYPLRSQVVTSIAVDALNQKWVGTTQGAYLLSSDGTKLLASYTSADSPLPSDQIRSIAIDDNAGIVYFGTDYGLASLTTSSLAPATDFSNLSVFPNPVYLEKGNSVNITIDGLIRDSEVKILSVTGKVITTIISPGGKIASWDGKDLNGNFVSSGVYIVVAYDAEGNSVGTTKVAVLRK